MKPSQHGPVALEEPPSSSQQADGHQDAPLSDRERLRVGDRLPAALSDRELMDVLGIRKSRFYALKKMGCFDRWQLRPALGSRPWSGALVERWLKCEDGASRFALTALRKKRA